MKKILQNTTVLVIAFLTTFGMLENVRSMGREAVLSNTGAMVPVRQVVVYRHQSIAYDNFNAAIFAQGQLGDGSMLPAGSEISLYVDANRVNGAAGLQTGARCTALQASESYYQDTITMDKRFCPDFNDAILDGRAVYGLVPTEAVFLHKANGERCYVNDGGNVNYLINPASTFFRNYLVKRGAEKLQQFNLSTLFLDDLQAGWNGITSQCGGNPKEYSNSSDYYTQLVGLAQYVNDSLPSYKIEGNLANASSQWDRFSFLDGAMCENCFTNWGGPWPTASRMLSDLSVMDKWVKSGHKLYVISHPPETSTASNLFTFAASLLAANNDKVFFHFSDYGQFYSIPEYKYSLGTPVTDYVCSGSICTRAFQYGTVLVDFEKREGKVVMQEASTATPTATFMPPTATLILPTATILTSIPASATPTATLSTPVSATAQVTETTPTPIPASPTVTPTDPISAQVGLTETASPTPTATPIPPTNTPEPTMTATPIPPTNTVAPTMTATPVPPTNTVVPAMTPTPIPPTAKPVSETTYDDRDKAFVYSAGWEDKSVQDAYKGTLKLTTKKDSSATINFTGNSFSIVYRGGPNYGKMLIYVDGVQVGTLDQKLAKYISQKRWDYTGQLAPGPHTLKLVFVNFKYAPGSLDAVIVRQ
ncbi:MAG: hypothetical protein HY865_16390 [Chloroflexi bacterium]|nr:hypothetical protein [Chloroflexota bacterium]